MSTIPDMLFTRPIDQLTHDELIEVVRETYKVRQPPPCRVCGRNLSLQDSRDMVWACDGYEDSDDENGVLKYQEGRSFADSHYASSRTCFRSLGDSRVMELIRRFEELRNGS